MTFNTKSARWGLLLLALLVILGGLGRLPFTDRDEGEYTTVAQNMNRYSDYVIPQVNDRAYYEKPALFFWAVAACFKVFGENEFAGRLPSALAGLALLILLTWFATREGGESLGILTALLTLTSFLVIMLARVVLVDMILTLWTTSALILFYSGYQAPLGRDKPYFYGGWAALGLAFLTKGPVGPVVILAALLPLAALNRDLWATLKRVRVLPGLVIFLIVAGPWYTLALWRDGRDFWNGFFVSQNLRRYTEVLLGHGPPLWYYLPVLAVLLWPWFFFALPGWWRGLFKSSRAKRREDSLAHLDFFLSLWFLTSLIIFSLSATKLPHYILPAAPALILLAARWWQERLAGPLPGPKEGLLTFGLAGLVGLLLADLLLAAKWILPVVLAKAQTGINPDSFEYALTDRPPSLGWGTALVALTFGTAVVLALYSAWFKKMKLALTALIAAGLVLIFGLNYVTAPVFLDYLQTPAREMAFQVRAEITPADRLAAYGLYKPTLWFYTSHNIERIRTRESEKLNEFLSDRRRGFLLSRVRLLPDLKSWKKFRLLGTYGGYLYGDNQGQN